MDNLPRGIGAMDCLTTPTEFQELVTVLEQEAAAIERLLTITQQLQECLVRFDTTGIEQLTTQQESQLQQLEQYARQRWSNLSKLLDIPLEKARQLALSEILSLLPPAVTEKVTALHTRLRDQLVHIQLANSINRMLALRGRNSIAATLAFVREQNLHALNAAL